MDEEFDHYSGKRWAVQFHKFPYSGLLKELGLTDGSGELQVPTTGLPTYVQNLTRNAASLLAKWINVSKTPAPEKYCRLKEGLSRFGGD